MPKVVVGPAEWQGVDRSMKHVASLFFFTMAVLIGFGFLFSQYMGLRGDFGNAQTEIERLKGDNVQLGNLVTSLQGQVQLAKEDQRTAEQAAQLTNDELGVCRVNLASAHAALENGRQVTLPPDQPAVEMNFGGAGPEVPVESRAPEPPLMVTIVLLALVLLALGWLLATLTYARSGRLR